MEDSITSRPLYTIARVIWYAFDIILFLLLVRLLLEFFAANPAAPFTQLINGWTTSLVAPFINLFPPLPVGPGIFDWGIIVAMLAYWIVAAVVVRAVTFIGGSI